LKEKDHVSNITNIIWNKEDCLKDVRELPEGSKINFKALARRYHLEINRKPANSGQIVKKFQVEQGIDLKKFNYHSKSSQPRLRRTKLRIEVFC